MRRAFSLLVVAIAALAGAVQAAPATRIGVVLAGSGLNFWAAMSQGMHRAAEDFHVELVMRSPSDGMSLGAQPNIQLRMIDYLVKNGVAGIVLAPEPLQDVATPISVAVPTVLVDRASTDYKAISIVSTDNYAAGRTAAMSLVPVLHKGARIAVLRLAPTISSTTQREEGFLAVASEMGWRVVIAPYVGYQFRETEARVHKVLSGDVGRLDAIFAPNETTAYGALRVVEEMPAGTRPRLVVFDWRPEFLAALEHSVVYADIMQDPYRMGYQSVETLIAALQGHPPRATIFIDVVTVTRANMNEPAIRAAIANYNR
ncbi:substrate-binding domain-containing protein [Paraburkholderia aromaticivorans]|uniref:LacI family transcriptional regulator n=1 Tax=Paraburkholderia aromaticivorans TaxID=2026199 RepID=A0A248VVY9_9BURK|nr:substrate-binding domain-containing protein [Paraburkholderia aromaticivorans]ASW03196.1 LacI family transcriptional regulator [Paraburkholderia aromaticivorans]